MNRKNRKNILIYLLFIVFALLSACESSNNSQTSSHEINDVILSSATITELKRIDIKIGDGKVALDQSKVAVHYSGWLYDDKAKNKKGKLFDTSFDLGEPLVFDLGQHQVIKGWEMGIPGMKVGGTRNLLIPAELAYGSKRIGTTRTSIPENSALVFDIELIEAM